MFKAPLNLKITLPCFSLLSTKRQCKYVRRMVSLLCPQIIYMLCHHDTTAATCHYTGVLQIAKRMNTLTSHAVSVLHMLNVSILTYVFISRQVLVEVGHCVSLGCWSPWNLNENTSFLWCKEKIEKIRYSEIYSIYSSDLGGGGRDKLFYMSEHNRKLYHSVSYSHLTNAVFGQKFHSTLLLKIFRRRLYLDVNYTLDCRQCSSHVGC
jgi:hypothetical protein